MKFILFTSFILFLFISCNKNSNNLYNNELIKDIRKLETSNVNLNLKKNQLDSILNIYKEEINTKENRNLLFEVAGVAYNINAKNTYVKTTNALITLSKKAKDTAHIAKSYYYLGDYYEDNYRLDSAYSAYSYAAKYYNVVRDTLNLGLMQKSKALILYEEGLYNQAEIEAFLAIQNINKYDDQKLILEAYTTIANILDQSYQPEEAILYYNRALNILKDLTPKDNVLFSKITIYNNIGYLYNNLEDFTKAEKSLLEGLSLLSNDLNNTLIHAMLLNNLASTYIKTNKLKSAKQLINRSFKIREKINSPQGIIASYSRMGEYFLAKKDTVNAIENWVIAYENAVKIKARNSALNNLKYLSLYDKNNSKKYTERYYEINDSIKNTKIENRTKFARIEFETAQLEQKNQLLSQHLLILAIISILSLFISALLYVTFKQKIFQKKLLFQQTQQEDRELIYKLILQQEEVAKTTLLEERNRISSELHDGIINTLFNIRLMLTQDYDDQQRNIVSSEIEEAQKQIRRISHNLQDQQILMGSFTPILEGLVSKNSTQTTEFVLLISRNFDWTIFDYEAKMNFYRIIQECIQNVIKHAKASRCIISIVESVTSYHIKIQDNGVGFETTETKKGIGLKNIQSRIDNLKGKLIVNSTNKGTVIEIKIDKENIIDNDND